MQKNLSSNQRQRVLGHPLVRTPLSMVAVAMVSMGLYACGGDSGDEGSGGATPPPVEPARNLVVVKVSEAPASVFAKTAKSLAQTMSLPIGFTQQYVATGIYSDKTTADLTATASWSSSDEAVATVVAGAALGHLKGDADISACQETVCSDPVTLAVDDRVVTGLTVTVPQSEVKEAGVSELTATASLSDGKELNVTTSPDLTWTSSDNGTLTAQENTVNAELAPGRFFGVKAGQATVSAAGQFSGKPFSDDVDVTVTPLEVTDFVQPQVDVKNWNQADTYCKTQSPAARLPTRLELLHIYRKAKEAGGNICDTYGWPMYGNACGGSSSDYWTGEVNSAGTHYIVTNGGYGYGIVGANYDANTSQVACVQ